MGPRDQMVDHMIDELQSLGRDLTPWEIRFLEGVSDDWDRNRELSDEQYRKLKQIYEDRV